MIFFASIPKRNLFVLFTLVLLLVQTSCTDYSDEPDTPNVHKGLPAYYLEQVIEKEKAINDAIATIGNDGYSFVFFTDAHWGANFKHSPAIIYDIVNNTSVNDVFFGGDIITTRSADKGEMLKLGYEFQSAFSFLGDHFYCLYGNHDNNSDGQANLTERHLSEDEVKGFLQSQMTGAGTTIEGYNFYVDIDESKTRVIGLDTGRYFDASFRDSLPLTVTFLIKALNQTPEGWHIIVASHLWLSLNKVAFEPYISGILKVMDAYNKNGSGVYTHGKVNVPYDFSGANSKIEFCIGGHNHRDDLLYSEGGIPVVVVDSDRIRSNSDKDSVYEQSVTVVVSDYSDKKATFYRIGRGKDMVIEL